MWRIDPFEIDPNFPNDVLVRPPSIVHLGIDALLGGAAGASDTGGHVTSPAPTDGAMHWFTAPDPTEPLFEETPDPGHSPALDEGEFSEIDLY